MSVLILLLLLSLLQLALELVDLILVRCRSYRRLRSEILGRVQPQVPTDIVQTSERCGVIERAVHHRLLSQKEPHLLLEFQNDLVLARLGQFNLALQAGDLLLKLAFSLNEIVDLHVLLFNDTVQVGDLTFKLADDRIVAIL